MIEHSQNITYKTGKSGTYEISCQTVLSKNPLVSVVMITYNHMPFIIEAIQGVLKQETDFPIELIIGEDCSTDRTGEIVLDYQKKYPDRIRVITSDTNVGMMNNSKRTMAACRGKYIALCEGDDYWTDPYKLQKQLDYLENNEDYGLIYSRVKVFNDKKGCFEKNITAKAFNNKELLLSNTIPTVTTMFRSDLYQRYILDVKPVEKNWEMGDYPIWLWFQFNSKIFFMNDITATYRLLTESASHSSNINKKYKFRLSSFNVADYYAKRYFTNDEYEIFLEHSYLFLYLFCLKHNISDKNEYIKILKKLKKIKFSSKFIITFFNDLKFEYAFILLKKNSMFRRLLNNLGARVVSIFGH
jgi:glycosyltransferase involved in cell wall biosynthesis